MSAFWGQDDSDTCRMTLDDQDDHNRRTDARRYDGRSVGAVASDRGRSWRKQRSSVLGDGGAAEGVVHADRDQVEVLTDAIDDHRDAGSRRTRDNTQRRQGDVSASHEQMVA